MIEDKKVIKPDRELAEEFIQEYNALCQKHGLRLVVTPAFMQRDDGTFSTIIQTDIGKLPDSK